ncbi:hypothetical protein T01_3758 [Trichinella spiralis]|uniref:PiggyBac transposable element-derived protein 4 C-terminal zinc-ribbon domain-containing protein n=1 Tax=Trichinella spiralis TaxID=6334 RepID=A0A0V1BZ84_TRISP|nr:hypothetical protein T01_3758 [Trichinella spiralis]
MIAGIAMEKATSLILLYTTIILKVAWITWINDISVFLSKNDSSMAIGNIVQNDRGIGIQRLRSLDRYTPNMECRTVAYTTKTLHGSSATRNVRRETLPRTATAKTAVERLRQEAEEPSTSTSTDTDRSGKKSPIDKKTSVRCQKCQKYVCKHHTQSYCNSCAGDI